jgi:tetratricopeptide (TPR) repeat protein
VKFDVRRSFAILWLLAITATAAGQARSFRTVTVVSEPNAAVWIDGVRYGSTDDGGRFTVKTVSPGKHTIRVRKDGFSEGAKQLTAIQKGDIPVPLTQTSDEAWLAFQEGVRQSALDRAKAAEAYRKAIKLNPKLTAARLGLARVLSDGGKHEEALAAIKELRRIAPRNAEASAIEGRIHKELGDETKAIAAFKRAITEGGGFQPEAYAGLGLLHKEKLEGLGDPDDPEAVKAIAEAAKNLSMAVKQLSGAPDAMVIMQLLGLIYEEQKRYKDAIAVYEDFLRTFPDSNEAEAVRSFIVQINKQIAGQ